MTCTPQIAVYLIDQKNANEIQAGKTENDGIDNHWGIIHYVIN